jgi:hypothetical protein
MNRYRRIRDEIRAFVQELRQSLTHLKAGIGHQQQFQNGIKGFLGQRDLANKD